MVYIWGDFSEKFQVLCKNPDEVTRFDGSQPLLPPEMEVTEISSQPLLPSEMEVTEIILVKVLGLCQRWNSQR
jgi:hypothetical protein